MTTRVVRVEGRVQRVGFRDFTLRVARRLNVQGTARNLDDGAVEIIAQGELESVEALVAKVRVGPPAADVTSVIVEPALETENYNSFEVG